MPRFLTPFTAGLAAAALLAANSAGAAPASPGLLPWQRWIESPDPAHSKRLDSLFKLHWRNSGGPEGRLRIDPHGGPNAGPALVFHVVVNYHNPGKYPIGWPSFEVKPHPPLDFSGYTAISYWIRCDTRLEQNLQIRFILWSAGRGRINTPVPPFPPGKWVRVIHRIHTVPHIDQVDRLHFFLSEINYRDGDQMTFRVAGFQLCDLVRTRSRLGPRQAACALWLGPQGDKSERIQILDAGAPAVPALLLFETGAKTALRPGDTLHFRFENLFTGRRTRQTQPLQTAVAPGQTARLRRNLDTRGLAPGYYLAVADVRRAGRSLLGGRVGACDLYIRRPGESRTFTVLSIRAGMALWLEDRLYGGIIGWAHAWLPHVYDPLDRTTYRRFLRLFATQTWKHTEGNEAGDTGLAFAARAFQKAGAPDRQRFCERLMDSSIEHMIRHMQAPSGATRTMTHELAKDGFTPQWWKAGFTCDSNQMGEWMRALTYPMLYYAATPGARAKARRIDACIRRAADFLVAHSTQTSHGIPRVIRHLRLTIRPDGQVTPHTYYQEGRQCDVYLGRALAGLSYYAFAMQRLGEKPPPDWWAVMENTVRWCQWKMKPNGWFDWQCGDVVEGGCHTYLGNIYVGEGLFGVYLAERMAGRRAQAAEALEAAHRAYRYITDACIVHGRRFRPPTEFWVGPYLYWLFTEYIDAAGPEPKLQQWLDAMDHVWRVEHRWRDFLDRPRNGAGYVGRATSNGMLNLAVLGYLGIREMQEIGRPFHWALPPQGP